MRQYVQTTIQSNNSAQWTQTLVPTYLPQGTIGSSAIPLPVDPYLLTLSVVPRESELFNPRNSLILRSVTITFLVMPCPLFVETPSFRTKFDKLSLNVAQSHTRECIDQSFVRMTLHLVLHPKCRIILD